MYDHIPREIVANIVHRLPAESFLRFRIVSKEWQSIIDEDDPVFPKPKLNMIVTQMADGQWHAIPLCSVASCSQTNPRYIRTIPDEKLEEASPKEVDNALQNPSLGQWIRLPHDGSCYGHGYEVKTNDYKVVGLCGDDNFNLKTLIYSAKSGAWHEAENFPTNQRLRDGDGSPVFANNALYSLTSYNYRRRDYNAVVLLDLSSETYRTLPLPRCITSATNLVKWLQVMDGNLFLSCARYDTRFPCWELWILQDCENGNGKWNKLMRLGKENVNDKDLDFMPVAYVQSKEEVLIKCKDRFMWFDLKNKECGNTVTIKGVGRTFSLCEVLPVCIDRLTGNRRDAEQSSGKGGDGLELKITTSCYSDFSLRFVEFY